MPCVDCGLGEAIRRTFRGKRKQRDDPNDHKCDKCDERFPDEPSLTDHQCTIHHVNLVKELITEQNWNVLFPKRWGVDSDWEIDYNQSKPWFYPKMQNDYYSYQNFIAAVNMMSNKGFDTFLNEPDTTSKDKLREFCAFVANIDMLCREQQEYERTVDSLEGANRIVGSKEEYIMGSTKVYFRPGTLLVGEERFKSASYHARGPFGLSFAYNYGMFGEAIDEKPQELLNDPDRLLDDPILGMASAIWFWMTQLEHKTGMTPHNAMYETLCRIKPWGFHHTIMSINGGYESGATKGGSSEADKKVTRRIERYARIAKHFDLNVGENGERLDTSNSHTKDCFVES